MQVKLAFELANKIRKCEVPTGTLVITRVPGMGLQGYHRPKTGRTQVFVPTGTVKTIAQAETGLISAWRKFVGLDEIRSFV